MGYICKRIGEQIAHAIHLNGDQQNVMLSSFCLTTESRSVKIRFSRERDEGHSEKLLSCADKSG